MRVFRKRKKFGNFRGQPDEAPLPDIVYQMGAEAAAQYVVARAGTPDPYDIDAGGIYAYDVGADDPFDEGISSSSPFKLVASALGFGRSRQRERRAARPMDRFVGNGSPVHFAEQPLGSPAKFRRRPGSPGFIPSRPSSPYHFAGQERIPSPLRFGSPNRSSSPLQFAQHSRPGSPDVIRRLQRAQLSQDLQRVEREQRRQQELMMMNPAQFLPQYQPIQQPYYSMGNPDVYMPAYQPQMYSYY